MVSDLACAPCGAGERPEVFEGPVFVVAIVKALLMKVLKIAAGLRAAEVARAAIVSGSDRVVRPTKRPLESFVLGTGAGRAVIRM